MINKDQIVELVNEKLADDQFVVDITVGSANQIHILVDGMNGLSIDNCVAISRHVEHSLDRDAEDFSLEVSSPGLDMPLKVFKQYQKNVGRDLIIVRTDETDLTGKLLEVNDDGIKLHTERKERLEGKKKKQLIVEEFEISFNDIKTAKVIIAFK